MTEQNIQLEAYRLIRQKARDIIEPLTNEELGQYVCGVVDLQTELYKVSEAELKNELIIRNELIN